MNLSIICVGKTPEKNQMHWIETYVSRTKKFCTIHVLRIKEKIHNNPSQTICATWQEIEKKIPSNQWLVLLDEKGKLFTTQELSQLFMNVQRYNKQGICFVVGGSFGLPQEAKKNADTVMSLSLLTLPHRLALLILCEQIYRVMAWQNKIPYHRE